MDKKKCYLCEEYKVNGWSEYKKIDYLCTPDNGPGADTYERQLIQCFTCNQYYIYQFIEFRGEESDSMTSIYIPVSLENVSFVNSQDWYAIRENKYFILNYGLGQ